METQATTIEKLLSLGPQAAAKAYQDILTKIKNGLILSPADVRSLEMLEKKLKGEAANNLKEVPLLTSLEEVAAHLGKSTRTVRRWLDKGLPRLSDGGFDLGQVTRWVAEKQGKSGGSAAVESPEAAGSEGDGKDFWDKEGKKWQAKQRELEYRKRLGELVERREVEFLFVDRIMAVTQGLEALARSLPPQLVHKNEREMEPVIATRVRGLREIYARPLPEKFGAEPTRGTDEE